MENLNLALLSSTTSSPLAWRARRNLLSPSRPFSHPLQNYRPSLTRTCNLARRRSSVRIVSALSSSGRQTTSVAANPQPVPPPPSQVGSPLFWIGVGVGFSAIFSWVASYLKKYAMQQAFKTMMNQMNPQNNQFNNSPFPAGSPFPFPPPTASGSANPPFFVSPQASPTTRTSATDTTTVTSSFTSQTPVTVDIPATEVAPVSESARSTEEETSTKEERKKYSFVDVSPEDSLPPTPSSNLEDDTESFKETVSQNGAIPSPSSRVSNSNQSTRKAGSVLSLDALEKMLEDPTIQQLVYPSLPEELRNPASLKWMLQNPQYRQQMEQMLNEMSGTMEWDEKMMDTLKNFDLNSPEVKQQFEQVGLTPQEAISKIIANPDIAMAFQNPRVQQAILDITQNPMNIAKYENDRGVMDVLHKMSELFPGGGLP